MASLSPPSSPTPSSGSSGEEEGSAPSSPVPTLNEEHQCKHCDEKYRQPRVLSCLHVFCTPCLEKLVEVDSPSELENVAGTITCPLCKQETRVVKGVDELPVDYVLANMLDISAIEHMKIVCTSCKAREKAVARCSDCANFLCPNCVTAHQYMRCFENHKVVSFEELQNSDGLALHKPIFCVAHATEVLKFFCNTCQVPICSECVMIGHKQPEHHYERIGDTETKHVEEIRSLVTESKSKIEFCNEATSNLEAALSDLQMQRDNARGLIEETFQTYRTMLEKRKDELLSELEEMHKNEELTIMDMFHTVEKTTERIEDGALFAERILDNGNSVEILLMKRLMASQLLTLINNTPKLEVTVKIEFATEAEKFEEALRNNFGTFKKPCGEQKDTPATSLHSSFENEGFTLPPGVLCPDGPVLPPVVGPPFMPALPPLNIPGMPSLGSSVSGVSAQTINSIASSMQNLNSDRSSSRNSYSPAMSDSGISVDAASTNSASNPPLVHNVTALTKLGSVSLNAQGQITVNGQVVPGLNVNSNTGMPTPRVGTPTNTMPDQTLASILSSINLGGGSTGRATTPLNQIPDITGLLNQPSPHLNGIGTLGASASAALLGQSGTCLDTGLPLNGALNLSTPPPPTPNYGPSSHPPFPMRGAGKMAPMQIRCKFGQLGPGKGQFNSPHGFCLSLEEDIIVADTNNHRIQVFEKTGEFKYQFGIPGREEGQLWYPRKVAVMRHSGKYVVCDRGNERSRMQIFTKNGHFIKKIAIRYIDIVAGLAITQQGHIVAVDSVSPTVFCIAETGDLLKWFDCSDYMREPSDIAISGKEYFVCDFKGHCVVVFNEEGQFMRRIGCENITNFPNGIDISDAGDVLVGDSHGNRFHVAVFQRDGSLIGEFECPYVKVSRCCGLKITSEGYVVTLAKNNHHVLVLNTLYIT